MRRILETKARLGLHENRLVDPEAGALDVARPEDERRATEIAERVTVDAQLWLGGIAVAVVILMVVPLLMSAVPGFGGILGG